MEEKRNSDKKLEEIIAHNLIQLRKNHNLKQSDLSVALGYSDKSISRWENATSVPDVETLIRIAEFYKIGIEDIVKENAVEKATEQSLKAKREEKINNVVMLLLTITTVWTVAVLVYVGLILTDVGVHWEAFIWAVPVSAYMFFRWNKKIYDIKWLNTILLSVTIWSLNAGVYFQLLPYSNFWQLFLLPIPIQCMIVIYTLFRTGYSNKI